MSDPGSARSQLARRLRGLRIDVTPLRESRDFRIVWASGLVTYLGSMITYVALPFQVAELTGSYLAVGLIGLAELVPLVLFGLYGGTLADRVDRRTVVLLTEAASGLLLLALLANALLPEPSLWVLYLVAVLLTASDGLQRPSLDAIVPRVVRHDQLAAAGALVTMRWNLGSIAGPAIGGALLASGGAAAAYAADAVTFAVSALLLARLRRMPPERAATRSSSLRHLGEGLRYARSRRDLLGTYAVDLIAMAFAFPYALFPFLARDLGAPWALGLLYAAGSAGGLAVTLTSGWIGRVHRHGRAVVLAAACWGAAIALAGLAPGLWWAVALLAAAGAADMVSGIFRGLMWNQTIPDEVRGRMAGIELLSYSIGPLAGQVRASGVAQFAGLRASIVSGGILCVAGVALAAATMPALWAYDARTDAHARRERDRRDPARGPGSPGVAG